jgi:flavodoxin
MKQKIITMALMLLSLVTTVCGQAMQTGNITEKESNMEKKILTVFFSMKGETYMAGGRIENLEKGNTNVCAEFIQKAVGGDLFEIETTKTYSKDHFKMIEEAKVEMQSGEKAQPKKWLDNLESYDVIFVGYPIWWGTYPPIINTFLEHYNLMGKTIIPFSTSEGSGLLNTVSELREICKGATVTEALAIRGSQARQSEKKVSEWAKKMITNL